VRTEREDEKGREDRGEGGERERERLVHHRGSLRTSRMKTSRVGECYVPRDS